MRSTLRFPSRLLLASATGLAALATGCDFDLWNDTSWIENVCPTEKGPQEAACVLDAVPGVFVRGAGSDEADGSRATPVATLARAVALAAGPGGPRRVYACAETFAEPIVVPSGVSIYGGLDCANGWAFTPEVLTTIAPPAERGVPVIVSEGVEATALENLHIIAAPTVDYAASASSVALVAASAQVNITRCVIQAGDAADGAPGSDGVVPPATTATGSPGVIACAPGSEATGSLGGAPVPSCDPTLLSGAGGFSPDGSGSGGSGLPAEPPGGGGGEGQPGGTSSWSCADTGKGGDGGPGAPGASGKGASTLGEATVTGFTAAAGAPGEPGKSGLGGGGGGASSGSGCGGGTAGASGGSGGPGGCGGGNGMGGGGGGASIAVLSVQARVVVRDSRLVAGTGGRGGDGGVGVEGVAGGLGGPGGNNAGAADAACDGGQGGPGGRGGNGGGGRGGHSVGIAFLGEPVIHEGTDIAPANGSPSPGGLGGGGETANDGLDGVNTQVLELGVGEG